jgi:hypothetical protein
MARTCIVGGDKINNDNDVDNAERGVASFPSEAHRSSKSIQVSPTTRTAVCATRSSAMIVGVEGGKTR